VAAGARLRDTGVTIILTTHYIEEAEEMADRIGVISKGELILVEDKDELMRKLGASS
jgi:ABC-2 type transport system ATP-binding protein